MRLFNLVPSVLGDWILEKGFITKNQLDIARAEQRRLAVQERSSKPIQEVICNLSYLDLERINDLIQNAFVLPHDATDEGGIEYEAKRLLNAILKLAISSNSTRANLEWNRNEVRFNYEVDGKSYEGPSLPESVAQAMRRCIDDLIAEVGVNENCALSGSFGLCWEKRKAVAHAVWKSESKDQVSFFFQYTDGSSGIVAQATVKP